MPAGAALLPVSRLAGLLANVAVVGRGRAARAYPTPGGLMARRELLNIRLATAERCRLEAFARLHDLSLTKAFWKAYHRGRGSVPQGDGRQPDRLPVKRNRSLALRLSAQERASVDVDALRSGRVETDFLRLAMLFGIADFSRTPS